MDGCFKVSSTQFSHFVVSNKDIERILSLRIIHFSSRQIFWDCATTSACEAIPNGLPFPLDDIAATERHWRERLSLTKERTDTPVTPIVSLKRARTFVGTADDSLKMFWKTAVRNYTRCHLTNPEKDRLAAIWGVAKLVRDAMRDEYGVGLWERELHEQLAWRVVDYKSSERSSKLSNLPSWSWGSVIGEIDLHDRLESGERCSRVYDHSGEDIRFDLKRRSLQERDLQPELASKRLAIRGIIRKGTLRKVKETGETERWTLDIDNPHSVAGQKRQRTQKTGQLEVFPDTRSLRDGEECYFLILATSRSMDMREIIESEDSNPTFSGVGIIIESSPEVDCFRRRGALRFHGMDQARYTELESEADKDFWLV